MNEYLSYEEFVGSLRTYLLDALNLKEKQVILEEKEENGVAPNGDRLLIECHASFSGKTMVGAHVEELYKDYQNGRSVEFIGATIVGEIEKLRASGILRKPKDENNYQKVKKDLYVRLMNKERHKYELEDAVYSDFADIACVVYMRIAGKGGCISCVNIHQENLNEWGVDANEVLCSAFKNTSVYTPPRIFDWNKLLVDPEFEGESFLDAHKGGSLKQKEGILLSTKGRKNGAVAVLLPGVVERIAELLDDDFYILFTSIHGAMIHAKGRKDPEDIEKVFRAAINETTPEEAFLSDQIYYYDRHIGKIMKYEGSVYFSAKEFLDYISRING